MSVAEPPRPPAPAAATARPASVPRLTARRLIERFRSRRADWKQYGLTAGISAALHALILGLCSLVILDQQRMEDILTTIATLVETENEPIVEQAPIQPEELLDERVDSNLTTTSADQLADLTAPANLDINDLDPSTAITDIEVPGLANLKISDETSGRSEAARAALVKKFGGNSASEAAVASGLKWLAEHQLPDGSWSFDHTHAPSCRGQCSQPGSMGECRTGATGLALLAFLGGGHTHQKGDYTAQVKKGLEALVKSGQLTPEGIDLRGELAGGNRHAAFYAQGIATIALCEVVALTRDPRYRPIAQGAVNFIVNAQDPKGGGWRYEPRQAGDTSVVGWQVMALKSGQNARLKVPGPVFKGAERFLDSVQADNGARYAYMDPKSPAPTTTAVGLLCRMYLGWDRKHKGLQDGIAYLDKTKPASNNMYYNYYATQVLHHWGGEEWTRWNEVMRNRLVATQRPRGDGHLAGSWDLADPHGGAGGRHYMTCLAVMTLEVYYRHLPIYQREQLKVEY